MGELTYRATVAAGKAVLRALDLRVRSAGAEHLPATGPAVLACNHVSFPDFVVVGQALLGTGRRVRFLCRADIWHSPAGPAMRAMRHVPVDRAAPAHAYLVARALLREGEVVCVFPEAGISAAYAVRALMPGAVALARETGAPLVPVTTWGGQRLWGQRREVGGPFPRPTLDRAARGRTVDVRIDEPWAVPPDADLVATTRRLGAHLQDRLETLQRLPEHRPRPGEWAPWYPAHLGGHGVDRAASYVLDAMPRSAITPTWGPGLRTPTRLE
ncbi:lysophospholipid acyltransferase family protein [Nocardioides litoris]|uniref:lysophospholipid acyltransferase family protein n=1 Tax=Nocardioides litoris TaxID=1926648 RepID=UPI00111EFE67|nr:lysophospholipid acyltransferase family protein [Nocardioides litoris]